MSSRLILIFNLLLCSLIASEEEPNFAGTLLTTYYDTTPKGHWNIAPYIYSTQNYTSPRSWEFAQCTTIDYGITDDLELTLFPLFLRNRSQSQQETGTGDFSAGFQYRFKQDPVLSLVVIETFPTGVYQKLKENKRGVDISGGGSYVTSLTLTIGNQFKVDTRHFLNLYAALSAQISRRVHVKGFNAYGGDATTDACVMPGTLYTLSLGAEYTLTKRSNFAIDLVYEMQKKTPFKGKGPDLSAPLSTTVSLAPALEYHLTDRVSLLGGIWFSPYVRNTSRFISYVFAVNIYL